MQLVIVDCTVYGSGRRQPVDSNRLPKAMAQAPRSPNAFVWIGLFQPDDAELTTVGDAFRAP